LGVILFFGAALLALDVGRSIWARVALEYPSSEYRPDRALYADLTWPPGADLPEHAFGSEGIRAAMCGLSWTGREGERPSRAIDVSASP
jgi:hypothetical protein